MKAVPTWGHMNAATDAFKERIAGNTKLPEDQRTFPEPLARYIWDGIGAALMAAQEYELKKPDDYPRTPGMTFGIETRADEV